VPRVRRLQPTPQSLLTIGGLLLIAVLFLRVSPANPPGFYHDEAAIAYNAYTLSATGKDEYGGRFPLFIKSFGDYKSPVYVYLLAAVYRITGPSMHTARTFSAVIGLAAVLLLYPLARSLTRNRLVALAVPLIAGLSPWLFEISRLVFEVALEPIWIVLFLLVLRRASTAEWRLRHSIALALLLAAMFYTYQAGRVFGPLFALGVLLFFRRGHGRAIAAMVGIFAATLIPFAWYWFAHPGALSERYRGVTWIHGIAWYDVPWRFVQHYAWNMNLWNWVIHGDSVERHHVQGDGSLFFVAVGLAIAGMVIVLLRRRSDPWWRFVLWGVFISPVAAALTIGSIMTLRMITMPIFFALLAIPALEAVSGLESRGLRIGIAAALLAAFAAEAVNWQVVFADNGPNRLDAFDQQVYPVIAAAFAHGGTVYASREDHPAYVGSLFAGAVAGRRPSSIVILDTGQAPPPGSLVVGYLGECPSCKQVAVDGGFESYLTPARG
jgi:4-amino-4-deoxy-L-arabinose transferase-like glycosyltransferase